MNFGILYFKFGDLYLNVEDLYFNFGDLFLILETYALIVETYGAHRSPKPSSKQGREKHGNALISNLTKSCPKQRKK